MKHKSIQGFTSPRFGHLCLNIFIKFSFWQTSSKKYMYNELQLSFLVHVHVVYTNKLNVLQKKDSSLSTQNIHVQSLQSTDQHEHRVIIVIESCFFIPKFKVRFAIVSTSPCGINIMTYNTGDILLHLLSNIPTPPVKRTNQDQLTHLTIKQQN